MQYTNFDVVLLPNEVSEQHLVYAASETQGEITARLNFALPLKAFEENNIQQSNPAQIKSWGNALFEALFSAEIKALLDRSLGEALSKPEFGLRIRLRLEAPELAALPWEMLYLSTRQLFLAASHETPIVRYLNMPEPIRAVPVAGPIRVLVIIPELWNLDAEAEKKILQRAFAKLRQRVTVDYLEGQVTPARMRETLGQHEYHLVHYIGHGDFTPASARLYLNGENNIFLPMTDEQFGVFFTDNTSVRLIVLNACQSGQQSSTKALIGLAPQLVKRGLPAVVAMQYPITDDDAIFFAREFYGALCGSIHDGLVDVAISRARNALWQESKRAHAFATPVLFMRSPNGRLWEQSLQEERIKNSAPRANAQEFSHPKKILLHSLPACLLFLTLVILAFLPKEQFVEIEAIVRDFAFRCSGVDDGLLIKALPVEVVHLTHFAPLHLRIDKCERLPERQLLYRSEGSPAEVSISPQHPIFSSVRFEGKNLAVGEIKLQPGMIAQLNLAEDHGVKFSLANFTSRLPVQLGDSFNVWAQKCTLEISGRGKTATYDVQQQTAYAMVNDAASPILQVAARQAKLGLAVFVPPGYFATRETLLEAEIETDSLSFLKDDFNRPQPISTLTDLSLTLPEMNSSQPYWKRNESIVYFKPADLKDFALKRLKLEAQPIGFRILLTGKCKKIEAGTNANLLENVMPSWLEWLWAQKKVGLIVSASIWLLGAQLTLLGFLNRK